MPTSSFTRDRVAYFLSNAVAETTVSPLRVLLVEDQSRGEELPIRSTSDSRQLTSVKEILNPLKYWEVIRETLREDGYIGLFKGNATELLFIPMGTVLNAYTARLLRNTVSYSVPTTIPQLCTQVVLYPLETIQTRLILQKRRQFYDSATDCTRMIYREEGLLAFWKGYGAQFVETLSVVAISEVFRRYIPTIAPNGLSEIAVGAAIVAVTNPLVVVRRKMQADRSNEFSSSVDCATNLVQTEGFLSLYRGAPLSIVMNSLTAIVANRIFSILTEDDSFFSKMFQSSK